MRVSSFSSLGIVAAAVVLTLLAGLRFCAAQTPPPRPPSSVLLSPRIESPATPAGAWSRQRIAVPSLSDSQKPPQIDGMPDEAVWNAAVHTGGFFRARGTSPVTEQTEAWLLCDRRCLYIAFHCLDSQPERIRAAETQRNGNLYNDDYFGISIDSQNAHQNSSTFMVSAGGTQAEQIEGGTADNISWTGDWHASVQRTPDGWTGEMAIPFRLLRYRKGTDRFGILLFRRLARETNRECWPYLPPESQNSGDARYMGEFTGLTPPALASRPVFLPYVLVSGGQSATHPGTTAYSRQGIDIKYPFTTTLTGVATLRPDFQTVEQQVTNISFSYTERFLSDRRPFFAEGRDYLPGTDQFYSRRVGQIDGGMKVVGKDGNVSMGVLGVSGPGDPTNPNAPRQVLAAQLRRDIGSSAYVLGNVIADGGNKGHLTNQTAKLEAGAERLLRNGYRPNFRVSYLPSWQDGDAKGAKMGFRIGTGAPRGRPNAGMSFSRTPNDFISDLGFIPNPNQQGSDIWLEQFNVFDKGAIESYDVGVYRSKYRHVRPDIAFTSSFSQNGELGFRNGWSVSMGYDQSSRDTFRDHTTNYGLSWGGKTRYQHGGIFLSAGQVADESYRFVGLNQEILVSRPFSLAVGQNWSFQGTGRQEQTVVTGTYRLNAARALATRLVRQTGRPDTLVDAAAVPSGTNIYFSYAQHVRAGYDLFLLVGDPNALTSRGSLTMKVIQPF